jgi:hypothetical protein
MLGNLLQIIVPVGFNSLNPSVRLLLSPKKNLVRAHTLQVSMIFEVSHCVIKRLPLMWPLPCYSLTMIITLCSNLLCLSSFFGQPTVSTLLSDGTYKVQTMANEYKCAFDITERLLCVKLISDRSSPY